VSALADVLLRGLALCGQAAAIGGVLCAWLVVCSDSWPVRRLWLVVGLGAAVVALAQTLSLGVLVATLDTGPGWTAADLLGSTYLSVSLVRIVASATLLAGALVVRERARAGGWWTLLLGSVLALVVSAAWASHAAGRVGHRGVLLTLDALHQLGAAAWIGGLLHLVVGAFGTRTGDWPPAMLKRFSAFALAGVSVLVIGGVGLTLGYVDGVRAVLGTAYGVMVLTKAVILGGLLALGAANFFAVRRLAGSAPVPPLRLRRFVEVELGLGLTVLFAAASLTSLPPAIDVVADRATFSEVAERFTPRWPTLTSPAHAELPVTDPNAPRTDADRAWSEYNHHVSGLFVLLMGLLASLYVFGRVRWARHWPLVFLGLAGFMFIRNDPGAWPLGPQGFWEGFATATVLQHRVFVLLVIGFGLFEWMVRTGRLRSPRFALVFPLLCAVGGALLLTHSHGSADLKSEFLLEITHTPLGVLGMLIAWARWLELRLANDNDPVPGRIWASGLVAFGALLLLYRES
jgi:putative copper resistance protein D